jgi:2,4-dienoyl-CoA reductase-like NADH-dependent reductase (Old Yellow Enzyme family)/thioredoxin reductase
MSLEALLRPVSLGGLALRNRIVSTSHAPGYAEGGLPLERYQRYHEEKARGGIALTMFGGSSSITAEVSPIYNQIDVSSDAVIPHLQAFARRIHAHDTRLMCQISHMGRRTAADAGDWIAPIGPSAVRDPAHHAVPRAMEIEDIERVVSAYGAAAARCAEGGLDGVEVMVPSHLPGQFLSPEANRRTDAYGGPLENRMRFLQRVLQEIRHRTPDGFVLSLRMAVDESLEGGPDRAECLTVARTLFAHGLFDLLNLNGIAASTTWGISRGIGGMSVPQGVDLESIGAFRAAVGAPVIHAGRIADLATAAHAIASGAVDLVGMTRAHMADPHIVRKLQEGRSEQIRPCVGASYCIDRIYAGRDAFCLHNPATGRETWLPQTVAPGATPARKVVVAGGGPAGLEAARIAAMRGHRVVLLEASGELGGQLRIASRLAWRRDLVGIVDWLAAEILRLGVVVRFHTLADSDTVLAEQPDLVVVATGGMPRAPAITGAELAQTSWDAATQPGPAPASALIYDEDGGHAAMSLAQHLTSQGCRVTIATQDRVLGRSLGGSSYPVYLGALADAGVQILTDRRLAGIERDGAMLRASLVHEYGRGAELLQVARVITELGTDPVDDLFHALKPAARNRGVTDVDALKAGTPQPAYAETANGFALFRIGDAVASRDVHAAMLDALRVLKDC